VPFELPLAEPDSQQTERADAARNRRLILAAAAELIAERGIEGVSMQDVAEAAGVGAGTLYRRFGDRAGLAMSLLDEETRAFQDAIIGGPPPLGPGAPAAERLAAFGEAYLDVLGHHADLLSVGQRPRPGGRGPYGFYATHLAILLREAAPGCDAEFTAQALLGALAPGLHLHLRRELDWPEARVRAGWRALAAAVVRP
jgi:AcrR family transcriptional regulator